MKRYITRVEALKYHSLRTMAVATAATAADRLLYNTSRTHSTTTV
jgi:hypothetical protein